MSTTAELAGALAELDQLIAEQSANLPAWWDRAARLAAGRDQPAGHLARAQKRKLLRRRK